MARSQSLSVRTVGATFVAFVVVVVGNVLTNGFGRPSPGRLVVACGVILLAIAFVMWRLRQFQSHDELHQRLELEALAAAFVGSFLIFVSYWLLQAAGLLPPLIGMYYAIGMVATAMIGSTRAWRRLEERSPDER
jgi:hypothetical protein